MLEPPAAVQPILSLIIPASNEEPWIADCLGAVFASDPVADGVEVIVVANGCRDRTADAARRMADRVPEGWTFTVLELEIGSKPAALNAGDAAAKGGPRVYLDADCRLSPQVLTQLRRVLVGRALYGGATAVVPRPRSYVTRAYARFWKRLSFNRAVAPGYGLFAVSAAGRARWGPFPDLISDDSFVRLLFDPEDRVQVPATYLWPMAEGFRNLVRTRRRQDRGVRELVARYPEVVAREGKPELGLRGGARLIVTDPVGLCIYAAVSLAVRVIPGRGGFVRGR